MADPNQNTDPNKSQVDPNSLKRGLQDLLDSQGDYNNLLKSALRDIERTDKAYEKIEARLATLNKESINIKSVNQELYRLRQKEYIETKRLSDLEKLYGEVAVSQLQIAKQKAQVDVEAYKAEGLEVDLQKEILYYLEKEGNLQAVKLYAQEQQIEYANEQIAQGKKFLQTEKDVSKQMGISGNLMQKFAEKLGVGEEAYAAMSLESRKLVDQNGKIGGFGSKLKVLQAGLKAGAGSIKESFSDPMTKAALVVGAYKLVEAGLTAVGNAASKAGGFLKGMSDDSTNIVSDLTGGIASLVKNIPLVGGLLGGLVEGASSMLDLIVGVDNAIIKMGRQLNLSADGARNLNRQYQDIAFNSGDIFTTSKKLFEAQVRISDQLGVTNTLSDERLTTMIKLNDIAGLDAETQKSIVESSLLTGQSSKDTVRSVLAQVQGLKQATGIQFQNQKILKETANLSGYLGLSFAKYPAQLTKSLLTVKAMGLELKEVDALADSFLDFESSISKEFEAQLLTGKDINLTKAREAFLNNDLATAAQEITTQVGSSADFLKLNRIQAESLAGAFGMSRDQLGEMLKKQEVLAVLGAKDTDNAREQLKLGLAKYKNQKALSAALGEDAYNSLVTASTQEKMAAYIEKIKQSIVDFIEKAGFIEKVEKFMKMISDPANLNGFLGMIRDTISSFIKTAGELLADVIEVGGEIANFFTLGSKGDEREAKAYEMAAKIRAGSLGMSAAVASVGGVSVGENKANNEVVNKKNEEIPTNKIKMGAPTTIVHNNWRFDPLTGKALGDTIVETTFYDAQTGQWRTQTSG